MAVLFTVLCGISALCLGYFITYFAKGHFVNATEAVLDSRIILIEEIGPPEEGVKGEYLYKFLHKDGTLPTNISNKVRAFSEGILVFDYAQDRQRYAARIYNLDDERKLLVGFNITETAKDFQRMQIMGVASILFVMLVVFVSYLISIFVASGTSKIAMTAQNIMKTGDLSRRLEVSSRWDDLGHMATVLNDLLARIEELIYGVRRVSDNIAHDLRTPLTRMKNQLEVLQQKYNDEDHGKLLKEADHLLSTFTALLRISRIETERKRSHFKSFDFGKLLKNVVEYYEPLAEEKDIALEVETINTKIIGDLDMVFQAYANILDNALKFTPKGGKIRLSMTPENGKTQVILENSNAHVPEADLPKIFERFYRTESSRSSSGTGLGLSLVKVVIDLHDGQVRAENTDIGFRIITIL